MKRNKLKGRIIERYGAVRTFAERIGVTPQTVSNVISGRSTPKGAAMFCWEVALDLTPDEKRIFFESDV